MKRFVVGDIHGAHKALIQCFERSKFKYSKDLLICLGDIVDGWNQTPQCIEEVLKIKNLVYILGNHDLWVDKWFKEGWTHPIWEMQGGIATKEAYVLQGDLLVKHRNFFDSAKPYYILENKLFVHGGIPPHLIFVPIEKQELNDLIWDREMFESARWKHFKDKEFKYGDYEEIYIGHTSTSSFRNSPVQYCNVWYLDQGAGWSGKLTIMDIDTHKYWQSDNVLELYPGIRGR